MKSLSLLLAISVISLGCSPSNHNKFLNTIESPEVTKCLGDDFLLLDLEQRKARYLKCKGYGKQKTK